MPSRTTVPILLTAGGCEQTSASCGIYGHPRTVPGPWFGNHPCTTWTRSVISAGATELTSCE